MKSPAGSVTLLPALSYIEMAGEDSFTPSGNVYVTGLTGKAGNWGSGRFVIS